MNFNGTFNKFVDDLVDRILRGLVIVRGHRYGGGAGFIWNSAGLILTNNHVVGRRTPVVLFHNDGEYEAKLLARNPNADLALLKIEAQGLSPLKAANATPRVGELVFAFGHPWGQRNSVTRGILSALITARTRSGSQVPVLRSDAPLAPGNSGGPLVNAQGQVIGINAMIMGGDQSLAIDISAARDFIEKTMRSTNQVDRVASTVPEGVM